MKGILTLKKSAVLAAVCMTLMCVSVHGEGASQEQKKILDDAKGTVEKFLHKGAYIQIDAEDEGCAYILASHIQGISIIDNEFSIGGVDLDSLGLGGLTLDLTECSISLDGECNIIIKPTK